MNASPRRVVLFANKTADETTSQPVDCRYYRSNTVYLTGAGTISGGNITIEEADYDPLTDVPYGGTWSIIGSATAASGLTAGVTLAVRLPVGAYSFVRVRINDAITGGGNVSASLRSNQ